jgi:hypothetical protein
MESSSVFTDGERAVLEALQRHGVRFRRSKDLAVLPALEEALAAVATQ